MENEQTIEEIIDELKNTPEEPLAEAPEEPEEPVRGHSGEVVPPPVQEPDDEELYNYALQLVAQKNPAILAHLAPPEEQPAEGYQVPDYGVPDDIYDEGERTAYAVQAATEPLKQEIEQLKQLLQPIAAERQQQEFANQAKAEGLAVGDEETAPIYSELFTEMGPSGMEAYKADPMVKALVDDAVAMRAERSRKPAVDEKPLPSAGLGVGGPGARSYDPSERADKEAFEKKFAHLGLSWEDMKS